MVELALAHLRRLELLLELLLGARPAERLALLPLLLVLQVVGKWGQIWEMWERVG
jgi:hypothetical protein